jgi:hypothetical protein
MPPLTRFISEKMSPVLITTVGVKSAIRKASTNPLDVTKPSVRLTKRSSAQAPRSISCCFAWCEAAGAAKKMSSFEEQLRFEIDAPRENPSERHR